MNADTSMAGILESAMDAIVSVDSQQRIVLFNAAAERLFGWSRDEILGRPLDLLIPARFRVTHRSHVDRFADTGVTSRRMGGQVPLWASRADGTEFPIEASISQHGSNDDKVLTVILRDMTQRLHTDAMLAASEARMRGILDSAMDAIITVDDQQRVVVFNSAAEKMFGWARNEAIGEHLGSFIPPRFQKSHVGHVQKFGITGVSSRRMASARVVTGMRSDGSEFPIDASISQLRQQGRLFYTVILRDVSELARAEAEVRASKEELQELASAASSALEREKSRIARELHDELAQSLTTLKMDISLIRVTQPDPDEELLGRLAKMEQQIDVTIKSMRRIAADLRPLTLDDLGLVPAVEALVNNFAQHSGIECELAVSQPEFDLSDAQATAVFRTVQEALTNIVKHAKAQHVEVVIDEDDGHLAVTISDDGVGFAIEAPRRDNAYGLLGLRERAYLLGGDAKVESAPGQGTSIEVRLPLARRVPVT